MVELDPPAAAAEVVVGEPMVDTDNADDGLLDVILEEAAVSSAQEDFAPGPPPPWPGLEARPERPVRRIWETSKLVAAMTKVMDQRDRVIADREVEIAWPDAWLAASGGCTVRRLLPSSLFWLEWKQRMRT